MSSTVTASHFSCTATGQACGELGRGRGPRRRSVFRARSVRGGFHIGYTGHFLLPSISPRMRLALSRYSSPSGVRLMRRVVRTTRDTPRRNSGVRTECQQSDVFCARCEEQRLALCVRRGVQRTLGAAMRTGRAAAQRRHGLPSRQRLRCPTDAPTGVRPPPFQTVWRWVASQARRRLAVRSLQTCPKAGGESRGVS